MTDVSVWNIIDFIDEFGVDNVNLLLSDFSTKREKDSQPLNPDIEKF